MNSIAVGDVFNYRLPVAGIRVKVLEIQGVQVLCEPMGFPHVPPEWLRIPDLGQKVT